jgi:RNA polymerase sigma-70 factor (ECF subfamily)
MENDFKALADGDDQAALLEAVYPELKRLASRLMAREQSYHTLQPTALVNEALMKFLRPSGVEFRDRAHFYAVASRAMRRILVDHARAKMASKRSPADDKVNTSRFEQVMSDPDLKALEVSEALSHLEKVDPRVAQVVEMRFFAGLTDTEIAEVLGMSQTTVKHDWAIGRAWLYKFIGAQV